MYVYVYVKETRQKTADKQLGRKAKLFHGDMTYTTLTEQSRALIFRRSQVAF